MAQADATRQSHAASRHPPDEHSPLLSTPALFSEAEVVSKGRLVFVLASVYLGVLLAALDTTIVATLSVPIATTFHSLSLLSWLGSSYLIAQAVCQPLSGRLTDIFSRRDGLVTSAVLFAAGTLMCGLAGSAWVMLAGRVVAGIGGGGMNAISTFVAGDLVPLRSRGVVQGVGHVCYGLGAGLGGLFGGWVNDVWGWRAAFLGRLPIVVVYGLLVASSTSSTSSTTTAAGRSGRASRLARIDFAGALALSIALILLLVGLSSGGNMVPWTHPLVVVSFPLAASAGLVFFLIESRWASEPIIPPRLLRVRTVLAAALINCFITMVLFMVTFYLPVYFQVRGESTTVAGIRLIPQSAGASLGSLGCGYVMKRTGKYRSLGLVVISCSVLGAAGLATMTFAMSTYPALLYVFLVGLGYGGMLSVSLLANTAAVAHQDQAVATSVIYAFRSVGSTLGVTVASVVYQNLLRSALHRRFDGRSGAAREIDRILGSLDELGHLPQGWSHGVYASYAFALRNVFITATGVAALGLTAAMFLRQHKLHSTISRVDHEQLERNENV